MMFDANGVQAAGTCLGGWMEEWVVWCGAVGCVCGGGGGGFLRVSE